MTLASRIAVMDRGIIRQVGTANDVYEYPDSRFVAGFIGSINMAEGVIETVENGLARIRVPAWGGEVTARADERAEAGQVITLAVRPEKVTLSREAPAGAVNVLTGQVRDLGYFGKDSLYRIVLDTGAVMSVNSVNARRTGEAGRVAQWDDRVFMAADPASLIILRD